MLKYQQLLVAIIYNINVTYILISYCREKKDLI